MLNQEDLEKLVNSAKFNKFFNKICFYSCDSNKYDGILNQIHGHYINSNVELYFDTDWINNPIDDETDLVDEFNYIKIKGSYKIPLRTLNLIQLSQLIFDNI